MLSRLDKLKAILTGHAEPKEKVSSRLLPEPASENSESQGVKPKKFIYPIALRRQQKAHSVKLLKGWVSDNPGSVRAKGCGRCQETPHLIAINYVNPCLALFGCHKADCNNKLIRVNTA